MNKKNKKRIALVIIAILGLPFFLYWQNNSIMSTHYTLAYNNLPKAFDGYKILQLSDLHNKRFGKDQSYIINKVKHLNPDIIVITGDTLSKYNTDSEASLDLFQHLIEIAPMYYVTGNHESCAENYKEFEKKLEDMQIEVLRDEGTLLLKEESSLRLIGVDDPDFSSKEKFKEALEILGKQYQEEFTILLSHRPEPMEKYEQGKFDLVFSGHAHGGQVRLPLIGGVVAPSQGFFPYYDSGIYESEAGNTKMVISKGLGSSIIPQRLFNRPEIIIVTLEKGLE